MISSNGGFILVVNPGQASRRYSVFKDGIRMVELHFEVIDLKVICTIRQGDDINQAIIHIDSLDQAAGQIFDILDFYKIDVVRSDITKIAVRVVAASDYFNVHRLLDNEALSRLEGEDTEAYAEIQSMAKLLPQATLVGISDSAFHSTIPEYIASVSGGEDNPDNKGSYGVSAGSVVNQLRAKKLLPDRLVICHLGYGMSATALRRGKSLNTSFGSRTELGLGKFVTSGKQIVDLRQVLAGRRKGDQADTLAVERYLATVQQLIGQMAASLGGIDGLVFTGAIGETSIELRSLLVQKLNYLGIEISSANNHKTHLPDSPALIGTTEQASLFVVSAREDYEMARLAEIIR